MHKISPNQISVTAKNSFAYIFYDFFNWNDLRKILCEKEEKVAKIVIFRNFQKIIQNICKLIVK